MYNMLINLKRVLLLGLLVLAGFASGWWWLNMASHPLESTSAQNVSGTIYVCPMHPHIHQDHAGSCAICGMDLVPKVRTGQAASSAVSPADIEQLDCDSSGGKPTIQARLLNTPASTDAELPAVHVSVESISLLGLKTALVEQRVLPQVIETLGIVAYNEDRLVDFVPRAAGWVDKLYVPHEGVRVMEGDKLLEFFSPDILSAQDGYVLALKSNYSFSGERRAFFDRVAREKLRLYGLSAETIQQVTDKGELLQTVPLLAPQSGVITRLDVDEGDAVSSQDRFMVIADPASLWVYADVYEHQIAQLNSIGSVTISSSAWPGQSWSATVDYIDTAVNRETHTLRVRLNVAVPEERLKPEMLVNVTLQTAPRQPVIVVPNEALIPVSRHEQRVVRINANGQFQPVAVRTGVVSQHFTEIVAGLEVGDRIVSSGQFLLDAESHLQASLQRMH